MCALPTKCQPLLPTLPHSATLMFNRCIFTRQPFVKTTKLWTGGSGSRNTYTHTHTHKHTHTLALTSSPWHASLQREIALCACDLPSLTLCCDLCLNTDYLFRTILLSSVISVILLQVRYTIWNWADLRSSLDCSTYKMCNIEPIV